MSLRSHHQSAFFSSQLEEFLFQSNPVPMWVYETKSLRFLAVNHAAVARYGFALNEFLGMTLSDIHLEQGTSVLHETPASGVFRHRARSGDIVWVDIISHDVTFAEKEARLVIAPDVTESQRAGEEARLLADNMADVVSILGGDGKYLYVSPSVEKATGYTVEEAMSFRACDTFHPDDVERVKAANAGALLEHGCCQMEWRRRCKDGTYRWFETTMKRLAGQPQRFICESRDIQQRKETEEALQRAQEQYRSIFENAVEGIFQTTPEGGYLAANPALARIYGYSSPAEMMARIQDIAQGLYVSPARRADFITCIQATGVVTNFESQVRRRDGDIIWIRENAHAVRDTSGHLLYYEGMVEDITDRKVMEAERERLLAEATDRADRDPLTSLWNHRVFHKRLKEAEVHTRENDSCFTVVLLDLDNFRFFNDVHGHAAGDDLLRRVASVFQNGCRPSDTLARFGGDEFALLLPHTDTPFFNDVHGHAAGDDLLRRVASVFQNGCRPSDTLARFGGDEFALLLPHTDTPTAEALVTHLAGRLRDIAYRPADCETAIPLHLTHGIAAYPADGTTRQDVLAVADARLLDAKAGGKRDSAAASLRHTLSDSLAGYSMLDALVTAVDNKDRYTRCHSEDVLAHCGQIASALGLDEKTRHTLSVAALLHDLGKIGIPDRILRKPGRLTDEEMEAVKQHPMIGSVIVGAVPGLEETLAAIRHHHERWDGSGYPFGLRGRECPLTARIMAVADAFSAMTMDRPYRTGMSAAKALSILERGAGTQWDPDCVSALLWSHAAYADEAKSLAA